MAYFTILFANLHKMGIQDSFDRPIQFKRRGIKFLLLFWRYFIAILDPWWTLQQSPYSQSFAESENRIEGYAIVLRQNQLIAEKKAVVEKHMAFYFFQVQELYELL